ncbi:MAG TPA: hypothetical protein VGD45_20450 [Steroidobacter sp.]|uniref:hypothetical protein n=1 Tax=Steroidobacter sp. TaxID=1978227 RepID=UPI002ED7F940
MIKRKQLFRHDPANGVYGDCHRTAIACLLDLEPDQVPHFGEHYTDSETFHRRESEWLETRGWCTVSVAYNASLDDVLRCQGFMNPDVLYLLGGKSRTGCGHTVIGCGDRIIWDPSLDDSGIIGPFDSDGLYWVTYLVPLAMRRAA